MAVSWPRPMGFVEGAPGHPNEHNAVNEHLNALKEAETAHRSDANPHNQYVPRNSITIADGTSVDTLLTPGRYVRTTSVGSSTALGYPMADWAGHIEVLASETRSFVLQRASFYSTAVILGSLPQRPRVWTRTKMGTSEFTAWVLDDGVATHEGKTSDAHHANAITYSPTVNEPDLAGAASAGAAIARLASMVSARQSVTVDNADHAITPGGYYIASSQATAMLNLPSAGAGFLVVKRTSNWIKQEYTPVSQPSNGMTFSRVFQTGANGATVAASLWTAGDVYYGNGSPEGRYLGVPGTKYTDLSSTNGAISWVKTSPATWYTGWKVTTGDTGWLNIAVPENLTTADVAGPGAYQIKRINDTVHFRIRVKPFGSLLAAPRTASTTLMTLPNGFYPYGYQSHGVVSYGVQLLGIAHTHSSLGVLTLQPMPGIIGSWGSSNSDIIAFAGSFVTENAWPANLPPQ